MIEKTLEQRGGKYGSFESNSEITQKLMKVISESPNFDKLSNQHIEAFHMIFHKIARCVCGDPYYFDNIHDIVGYAKLLEQYISKGDENE